MKKLKKLETETRYEIEISSLNMEDEWRRLKMLLLPRLRTEFEKAKELIENQKITEFSLELELESKIKSNLFYQKCRKRIFIKRFLEECREERRWRCLVNQMRLALEQHDLDTAENNGSPQRVIYVQWINL